MLLENISLGIYYPGSSLLHRLRARTKLLALLWIVIWLTLLAQPHRWHFVPYIMAIVLILTGVALAGVAPREIWKRTWLLMILMAIGSLGLLFASPRGSKILLTIGPMPVFYGFLSQIVLICAGIALSLFLASLLPIAAWRKRWQRAGFKRLRIWLIIILLMAALFMWLTVGTQPGHAYLLGPLLVTEYNVWSIFTVYVVMLVLYVLSLLLTMTTTPVMLVEGLTLLLSPLRALKLPVDDFALMSLLALRFIPTLVEEVGLLMKAQTARGADIMHGTGRERLQSLVALFGPLMQNILRRASELAVALEARGYQADGKQVMLHETSLGRLDYIVLGVVLLATLGSLLF
ncbi:energy-coupling factor transporter transmembrane protein EcfT [Ktedonosporobacter rubrisoli]|uniref:Energy-coupling factor transporter transmembrane protein EcfT n=1 Tax=Ktedonosporobacter rubrisoli TaxID=2509675 RepID=A0A4V0YZ21_KTERU|nr:energy-coupling factor transporter transmembrane component T [Ktedonosporobacter rubrisoli]QBD78201.1 energy-coupling factor transporter transmembrane protein EcfT [Ktedonosporobacter rubrisoli]